jgi:hypothetical protein
MRRANIVIDSNGYIVPIVERPSTRTYTTFVNPGGVLPVGRAAQSSAVAQVASAAKGYPATITIGGLTIYSTDILLANDKTLPDATWSTYYDTIARRYFYLQASTQTVQYDHPSPPPFAPSDQILIDASTQMNIVGGASGSTVNVLPPGWLKLQSASMDTPYYLNIISGETRWIHPNLPPNPSRLTPAADPTVNSLYKKYIDPTSGRPFYIRLSTTEGLWTFPEDGYNAGPSAALKASSAEAQVMSGAQASSATAQQASSALAQSISGAQASSATAQQASSALAQSISGAQASSAFAQSISGAQASSATAQQASSALAQSISGAQASSATAQQASSALAQSISGAQASSALAQTISGAQASSATAQQASSALAQSISGAQASSAFAQAISGAQASSATAQQASSALAQSISGAEASSAMAQQASSALAQSISGAQASSAVAQTISGAQASSATAQEASSALAQIISGAQASSAVAQFASSAVAQRASSAVAQTASSAKQGQALAGPLSQIAAILQTIKAMQPDILAQIASLYSSTSPPDDIVGAKQNLMESISAIQDQWGILNEISATIFGIAPMYQNRALQTYVSDPYVDSIGFRKLYDSMRSTRIVIDKNGYIVPNMDSPAKRGYISFVMGGGGK